MKTEHFHGISYWQSMDHYEKSLLIKRNELLNQIKPSECGILVSEYIKCGKENCKCNTGSLHGPYWYHYFWDNGKLRKKYVCATSKRNQQYFDLLHKIESYKENKIIFEKIKEINSFLKRINKIKSEIDELLRRIDKNDYK